MNITPDNDLQALDRRTTKSICDAIGERLQQYMRPETVPSERFQHLLKEFRRRESTGNS